jgi:hypothetical protein
VKATCTPGSPEFNEVLKQLKDALPNIPVDLETRSPGIRHAPSGDHENNRHIRSSYARAITVSRIEQDAATGCRIKCALCFDQSSCNNSRGWIAAEHERHCLRVGVSHGADHSETITGVRHVLVGKQEVKVFRSNATESFAHGRDYLKVVATEPTV